MIKKNLLHIYTEASDCYNEDFKDVAHTLVIKARTCPGVKWHFSDAQEQL